MLAVLLFDSHVLSESMVTQYVHSIIDNKTDLHVYLHNITLSTPPP